MEFIKQYAIALTIFFIIDIAWLGFIAKKLYRDNLGFIMADKTNWAAAIIFYSLFIVGLVFFAIRPTLAKNSILHALQMGALFGFATYFTYDMTNLATLKNWPLKITIIDIIWGTSLNGLTAAISVYLLKLTGS